jgi:hypothetical protein
VNPGGGEPAPRRLPGPFGHREAKAQREHRAIPLRAVESA